MKNQVNLNIKTPCQENYNQFTSTKNGGFCNACEKEVIDFTVMSSGDIIKYFTSKSKEKNTCGRFKTNQLNTHKLIPQQRKRLSLLSGIGMACLSIFSIITTQAQDTKTASNKTLENNTKINTSKFQNTVLVKGTVTDSHNVIPGVNIILEGTAVGVTSDFDGNFTFPQKLKKGDVLTFSFIGYDSQKVVIENANSTSQIDLKINMTSDNVVLMGKITVKEVYKSKRNK